MDGPPGDRDSELGDDSPMSHNEEEMFDNEQDIEETPDSSDEAVGPLNSGMNGPMSGLSGPLGALSALGAHMMVPVTTQGLDLSEQQHNHHMHHPSDVLEKLKMQVRDIKVDRDRDSDYESGAVDMKSSPLHSHLQSLASLSQQQNSGVGHLAHGGSGVPQPGAFQMPFPFPHPAVSPFMPPPPASSAPSTPTQNGGATASSGMVSAQQSLQQPGSGSSSSSEGSASSQQTWSFEEQFKQVRQLYEINDDPKRKEFLDDLFQFMQKRGTPINRLPIMAKSVLDLFELYNLVIARGGLVDVINKKLWQEIIKGLHLPSSITSAAFTLRTQYMKYLYPYECDKKNLSTPSELQAAIDGNRREGRRSSYGQYENQMQNQLSLPAVQRSPVPSMHLSQQMSPLSLVTHHAHHVHQAQQAAQQAAAQHQRAAGLSLMGHSAATGLAPHEIEQRMIEYMKLFQHKDARRLGSQSPPETVSPRDAALNALEMSRLTLWNLYNNNTSPPSSINNTSPPGTLGIEPQSQNLQQQQQAVRHLEELISFFRNREALNLSESPPHQAQHNTSLGNGVSVKRELSERDPPPPAKRPGQALGMGLGLGLTPTELSDGMDSTNIADEEERPAPPIVMGTHFKITSRGDSRTGDQQLVVTMELNGVLYEGVLFANTSSAPHSPQAQRPRPMVT